MAGVRPWPTTIASSASRRSRNAQPGADSRHLLHGFDEMAFEVVDERNPHAEMFIVESLTHHRAAGGDRAFDERVDVGAEEAEYQLVRRWRRCVFELEQYEGGRALASRVEQDFLQRATRDLRLDACGLFQPEDLSVERRTLLEIGDEQFGETEMIGRGRHHGLLDRCWQRCDCKTLFHSHRTEPRRPRQRW